MDDWGNYYEETNFTIDDLIGCLSCWLRMNLSEPFNRGAFTDYIKYNYGDSLKIEYPTWQHVKITKVKFKIHKKVYHLQWTNTALIEAA